MQSLSFQNIITLKHIINKASLGNAEALFYLYVNDHNTSDLNKALQQIQKRTVEKLTQKYKKQNHFQYRKIAKFHNINDILHDAILYQKIENIKMH